MDLEDFFFSEENERKMQMWHISIWQLSRWMYIFQINKFNNHWETQIHDTWFRRTNWQPYLWTRGARGVDGEQPGFVEAD